MGVARYGGALMLDGWPDTGERAEVDRYRLVWRFPRERL